MSTSLTVRANCQVLGYDISSNVGRCPDGSFRQISAGSAPGTVLFLDLNTDMLLTFYLARVESLSAYYVWFEPDNTRLRQLQPAGIPVPKKNIHNLGDVTGYFVVGPLYPAEHVFEARYAWPCEVF